MSEKLEFIPDDIFEFILYVFTFENLNKYERVYNNIYDYSLHKTVPCIKKNSKKYGSMNIKYKSYYNTWYEKLFNSFNKNYGYGEISIECSDNYLINFFTDALLYKVTEEQDKLLLKTITDTLVKQNNKDLKRKKDELNNVIEFVRNYAASKQKSTT